MPPRRTSVEAREGGQDAIERVARRAFGGRWKEGRSDGAGEGDGGVGVGGEGLGDEGGRGGEGERGEEGDDESGEEEEGSWTTVVS